MIARFSSNTQIKEVYSLSQKRSVVKNLLGPMSRVYCSHSVWDFPVWWLPPLRLHKTTLIHRKLFTKSIILAHDRKSNVWMKSYRTCSIWHETEEKNVLLFSLLSISELQLAVRVNMRVYTSAYDEKLNNKKLSFQRINIRSDAVASQKSL